MATIEPLSDEERITNQAKAAARVIVAFRTALWVSSNLEGTAADEITKDFASLLLRDEAVLGLFATTERRPAEAAVGDDHKQPDYRRHNPRSGRPPFTCCAFSGDSEGSIVCPITGVGVA